MYNLNKKPYNAPFSQGGQSMVHIEIPSCYYDAPILKVVDSLISAGNTSYTALDDYDKARLTCLCMQALGTDAHLCITDTDLDDVLTNLKGYLLTANHEYKYDLVEKLERNAINYFEFYMDMLFEKLIEDNRGYSHD